MDFIVTNERDFKSNEYVSLIPDSVIEESFGEAEMQIRDDIIYTKIPEETFEAIRTASSKVVSPRALLIMMFETSDAKALKEPGCEFETIEAFSKYAIATCLAQRAVLAFEQTKSADGNIAYGLHSMYGNTSFVSDVTLTEVCLMKRVLKIGERLDIMPEGFANPVSLIEYSDWNNAQDIAVNLYLTQGTGTVITGYTRNGITSDIQPERIIKKGYNYKDFGFHAMVNEMEQERAAGKNNSNNPSKAKLFEGSKPQSTEQES